MFRKVVLASAIALAATPAQAKLFDVTLSWNNNGTLVTENFSFNDAEEAIDVVDIDFIIDKWGQSGFNETTDTAIADIAHTITGLRPILSDSIPISGVETIPASVSSEMCRLTRNDE